MKKECIRKPGNAVITEKMNIFLTTDHLTSILDVTSSSGDLVRVFVMLKKLKNMVKICGETKNFIKRMMENRKLAIIMPVEVNK